MQQEVTEITVELEAVSHVFEAGHRMGVMISSSDFPLVWPLLQHAVNSISIDTDHPPGSASRS